MLTPQARLRQLVVRCLASTVSAKPQILDDTRILVEVRKNVLADIEWNATLGSLINSLRSFGPSVVHASDWSKFKILALNSRSRMDARTALRCLVVFSQHRVCSRIDARRFQETIARCGGFGSLSAIEQVALLYQLAMVNVDVVPMLTTQVRREVTNTVAHCPTSHLPRLTYGFYHVAVRSLHSKGDSSTHWAQGAHALISAAKHSELRGLKNSEKVYLLWGLNLLTNTFSCCSSDFTTLLLSSLGIASTTTHSSGPHGKLTVDVLLGQTQSLEQLRPRDHVLLMNTLCSAIKRSTLSGSSVVGPAFFDVMKEQLKKNGGTTGVLVADELLGSHSTESSHQLKPHLDTLCIIVRTALLSCSLRSREVAIQLLTDLTRSGFVFCSTDAQIAVHLLLRYLCFNYRDAVFEESKTLQLTEPLFSVAMLRDVPALDDGERDVLLSQRLSTDFLPQQVRLRRVLRDVELIAILRTMIVCRDLFDGSCPTSSATGTTFYVFYRSIVVLKLQGSLLMAAPRNIVPLIYAALQAEVIETVQLFQLCVMRLANGAEALDSVSQRAVIRCAMALKALGEKCYPDASLETLSVLQRLIHDGQETLGLREALNTVLSCVTTEEMLARNPHRNNCRLSDTIEELFRKAQKCRSHSTFHRDLGITVRLLARFSALNANELSRVSRSTLDWLFVTTLRKRDSIVKSTSESNFETLAIDIDHIQCFATLGHRSPLVVTHARRLTERMIEYVTVCAGENDEKACLVTGWWLTLQAVLLLPPSRTTESSIAGELRSVEKVLQLAERTTVSEVQFLQVLCGALYVGVDGIVEAVKRVQLSWESSRTSLPSVNELCCGMWRGGSYPSAWKEVIEVSIIPFMITCMRSHLDGSFALPRAMLFETTAAAASVILHGCLKFEPSASKQPPLEPNDADQLRVLVEQVAPELFCESSTSEGRSTKPIFAAQTVQEWLQTPCRASRQRSNDGKAMDAVFASIGDRPVAVTTHPCAKIAWIATVLQQKRATDSSKLLGAQIWRQSVKYLEKLATTLTVADLSARSTLVTASTTFFVHQTDSVMLSPILAGADRWLDVSHIEGDDVEVECNALIHCVSAMVRCGASSQSIDTLLLKSKRRMAVFQSMVDVLNLAALAEGILVSGKRRPAVTEFIASAIEVSGLPAISSLSLHDLVCLAELFNRDAERVTLTFARADAIRTMVWVAMETQLEIIASESKQSAPRGPGWLRGIVIHVIHCLSMSKTPSSATASCKALGTLCDKYWDRLTDSIWSKQQVLQLLHQKQDLIQPDALESMLRKLTVD